ncbi:hypothetical protein [Paenibacillus sp. GCM10012306]
MPPGGLRCFFALSEQANTHSPAIGAVIWRQGIPIGVPSASAVRG